jgi:DNA-binding CsgD family transcriptional regulator
MVLTERRLREFFPYNNRFIHFVAKRWGYSFHNSEVVDSALFYSGVNITRYIAKHGREFDTEREMVGAVMYCIKYGILNAYGEDKRRSDKGLDIRLASDFIINPDSEDYSKYNKALAVEDTEVGGFEMLYKDSVEHSLTHLEREVMNKLLEGYSFPEIDKALGLRDKQASLARSRVRTKAKKAIKLEHRNEKQVSTNSTNEEQVQESLQHIPFADEHKSNGEDEKKRSQYIEAMSFLYSEEEVQYEVSTDWVVS